MYDKLFIDMGNRIRKRRLELGYSQEAVGECLNLSNQTISDTENGKKGLKLKNFIKLCSILNVSADYIITGREPSSITLQELDSLTDKQAENIRNIVKSCIDLCGTANETDV